MCKINENSTEIVECESKQICCKMQTSSIRRAVRALRLNQGDTYAILKTLKSIYNLLEVYSCLPATCLLERVTWVYQNIVSDDLRLNKGERIMVNMLISELETFLNNS